MAADGVQAGERTMPLQDDTLREVWASDRCGRSPAAHLNPGGPTWRGWEGRGKGTEMDYFATRSGPAEEEGSPEAQRRPKQVRHCRLGKRQRDPPTVSRSRVGDLGGGPSAESRGVLPRRVWFACLFVCGKGCSGGGHGASRGGIGALARWRWPWCVGGSSFLLPRRLRFPSG